MHSSVSHTIGVREITSTGGIRDAQGATEEVELQQEYVLRHRLLRGHVSDTGQGQDRMRVPAGSSAADRRGVCATTTLSSARLWIKSRAGGLCRSPPARARRCLLRVVLRTVRPEILSEDRS
jgi:hypothetical protein